MEGGPMKRTTLIAITVGSILGTALSGAYAQTTQPQPQSSAPVVGTAGPSPTQTTPAAVGQSGPGTPQTSPGAVGQAGPSPNATRQDAQGDKADARTQSRDI